MEARLPPIDGPSNPLLRFAYRAAARQFGQVITPMRVIYARKPRLLPLAAHVQRTMERGLSLDPGLRLLIQVQASRANGCSFCEDLGLAHAVRCRLGTERFAALEEFGRISSSLSASEAATAFTSASFCGLGIIHTRTFSLSSN